MNRFRPHFAPWFVALFSFFALVNVVGVIRPGPLRVFRLAGFPFPVWRLNAEFQEYFEWSALGLNAIIAISISTAIALLWASARSGRFAGSIRHVLTLGTLAATFAVVAWPLDAILGEHCRRLWAAENVRAHIGRLALTTPQGLSDNEWVAAVRWTDNIHVGSLLAFESDLDAIRQLDHEIVARETAGADMATIDWLWDRFAQLTPSGRRYRENFRDQMRKYVEYVRTNGDVYGDLSEFLETVRRRHSQ